MIYTILPTLFLLFVSYCTQKQHLADNTIRNRAAYTANIKPTIDSKTEQVYKRLHSDKFALPKLESFIEAFKGYYTLKEKGVIQKEILTIIDFSLSSNVKRLWVINIETGEIVFHSLVAHGRNTGEEYASQFSNAPESYKSSLGFYATGEIYTGKHGMSLRLDGLEKGVNDNARARGVVMHAADYVSDSFIKNNQRLGRSQGCPAVPAGISKEIITLIQKKSCFFIYHPSRIRVLSEKNIS